MFEKPIDEIIKNFKPILDLAISEDIGSGDVTTNALITKNEPVHATIVAKENLILCGMPIIDYIFKYKNDAMVNSSILKHDGERIERGDIVYEIDCPINNLLSLERIALNVLQRLSGISTKTDEYVTRLKGTRIKLLDTRKTMPGYRLLEKYAVKTGGGTNHRLGLFDMFLIKDNHIKAAGGIKQCIQQAKSNNPNKLLIEIECKTLDEIAEAILHLPDIILLDNMDDRSLRAAIDLIPKTIKTEISGNVTIGKLATLSRLDVNYISCGALTHSYHSADLSLNITN